MVRIFCGLFDGGALRGFDWRSLWSNLIEIWFCFKNHRKGYDSMGKISFLLRCVIFFKKYIYEFISDFIVEEIHRIITNIEYF
jgi:hypothetical protein